MSRSRKALRTLTAFVTVTAIVGSCDGSTDPRGPGSIAVSSIANSVDTVFQYGIAIDNSTPRMAFVGQLLLFTQHGLSHGEHAVTVTNTPAGCTGANSRTVTLQGDDTASVIFTINCPTTRGTLRFETSITGADRDPDGLVVNVDGDPGERIPFTSATNVRVAAGTHSYSIADVQPNCTVTGPTTGTHTVAAGSTITITLSANCTAIPQGAAGSSVSETAADTLVNTDGNPNQAHDVVTVSSRYTPGFLIVTMRFARTITPFSQSQAGLVGFFELDTDENINTGLEPLINNFGGSASQGVDFGLLMHEMDSVSMQLVQLPTPPQFPTSAGRVRARFDADSVVIFFPLNKLNDDGKLTVSATVGTADRPTDIVPNTGQILLQPSAGPMVMLRTERERSAKSTGEKIEYPQAGTWRRKP